MKKVIMVFSVICCGFLSAYAYERTAAKIQGVTTPVCISISTSSWVAIPSTTTIKSGRGGIIITAPDDMAGRFNISLSSYTVQTPSWSTSTFTTQIKADDTEDLEVSQFIHVFAVSSHTAAQTLCYQEYTFDKDR